MCSLRTFRTVLRESELIAINYKETKRHSLERTVNVEEVGALEARMFECFCDRIEVNFLALEGRFLATLLEEEDVDEPEGALRPVLRASGYTIVEAVMQLELAYQQCAR